MGKIVVCGGSVIGLSVAIMLAQDGHEVTVLEADPDGAPTAPCEAWTSWTRKGVAQFRQPHNLFARFRQICDEEIPGVTERLLAAGCVWVDYLDSLPPTLSDRSPRPGDDMLRFVTGRRPVIESVVAAIAEDQPGVSVRREFGSPGCWPAGRRSRARHMPPGCTPRPGNRSRPTSWSTQWAGAHPWWTG